MSYKFGAQSRKDRISARFLSQVHAMVARAALEARKERGATQSQVAREMGVDRATISRLLSGAGNPTIRTIGELAGVMGYRPELVLHKIEQTHGANHGLVVVKDGTTVVATPRNETAGGEKAAAFIYRRKPPTVEAADTL